METQGICRNGYLAVGNEIALAEKVFQVLMEANLREQLSFAAYVTAKKYSQNQIAEREVEVYNRAICGKEAERIIFPIFIRRWNGILRVIVIWWIMRILSRDKEVLGEIEKRSDTYRF